MSKIVTLRKSGNSLIFTAPADLEDKLGTKYQVIKGNNGVIIYEPIHHKNIFSEPEWKNYDYQNDLENDPELNIPTTDGKENIE